MNIISSFQMKLDGEWRANVNYYDDGCLQLSLYCGYSHRKDFYDGAFPYIKWPWRWGESFWKRADRLVERALGYIRKVDGKAPPRGLSSFEEWSRGKDQA